MHRASVALTDEDESDDWREKQMKRKKALRWFYIWSIVSLIIAATLLPLRIWLLVSFGKFNIDNNNDDDADPEIVSNLSKQWIGGIISLSFSPVLLFKQTFTFVRDVLPYLRRNSKDIFQAALLGDQYSRRDFSQDMGYMGEIKKEAEYLFDFLREKNASSRNIRMCLFVDDLDRSIDTRLVVASIDEHYTVHDRAGINGYDFLEKIVQLPFCFPDLSDSKKQKFMGHLFLHEYLKPAKICDVISSLQQERTYPQVALMDAAPQGNDEKVVFEYLVEQFVTNLDNIEIYMTEAQKLYFSKCDASTLLESGDSEKESFLVMIASYLQHIQELAEEIPSVTGGLITNLVVEEKVPDKHESEEDEAIGETNVVTEGKVHKVEENMPDEPESKQENNMEESVKPILKLRYSHEDEESNTSALSIDLKRIAPFASMVTPKERKWFKDFAPFMVGKARSITRVVNVYNLARYVAGQLLQNYTNDDAFKRKLMKVIILAEF